LAKTIQIPENQYFLNGDQLPIASEEKDLGV
jgi:hypothetical protein